MRRILIGLTVVVFFIIHNSVLFGQDLSNKLQMLEIVISNLVSRVDALEKRIGRLEKKLSHSDSVSEVPKKKEQKDIKSQTLVNKGYEDIGDGFFVRNVNFSPFSNNVLCTGEVYNKSGKNYRFAKFRLTIYDGQGMIIKKQEFTIPDIPKDSSSTFKIMIVGINSSSINRYELKLVK